MFQHAGCLLHAHTNLGAAPLLDPEGYRASRNAAVVKLREFTTAVFPTGTTFFLLIYGAQVARRAGAMDIGGTMKPYQAWNPSTWEDQIVEPLKAAGITSWAFSPKASWSPTTAALAAKLTSVDKQILGVAANQAKARTWLAAYDAETERAVAKLSAAAGGGSPGGNIMVPPPGARPMPAFKFTVPWLVGGLVVLGGLIIWKQKRG